MIFTGINKMGTHVSALGCKQEVCGPNSRLRCTKSEAKTNEIGLSSINIKRDGIGEDLESLGDHLEKW